MNDRRFVVPGRSRLSLGADAHRTDRRPVLPVLAASVALLLIALLAGCSDFFTDPFINSIFISPPSATVAVGNTVQLTAQARFSDGSTSSISGSSVGWTSSNTGVATISSPGGLVTALSTGTATMTVTDQGVTATANVTVTPTNVSSLVITTTQGSTVAISNATISGAPATLQFYAYANGTTNNDLTNAVSWTSSNTSVATISSGLSTGDGLATSVAAGTTNITATITNSSTGQLVQSNTVILTVQ